jgi:hypothetical protein
MKKYLYILLLLFPVSAAVHAQNNNSPYSIIGIGDIENDFFNRTAGLAYTGAAARSDRYIINNNPASYTALTQQFFALELSARGQFVTYLGDAVDDFANKGKDFAVKHLSLGTKVNKIWGTSVGLMPFSTANYSFSSFKNILGTDVSVPVQYDGSGGVNQVYWGNALQITKHLSVGVNAAYLFGSLTQTENLLSSDLQTSINTMRQIYLRNFYFTYGLQYYTPLNKSWDLSLGGTYANKRNLDAEYDVKVTDENGAALDDHVVKNDYFRLPNSSSVGFSLTKNKKYTLSADYKYQDWGTANYSGVNYSLRNSQRISAGFEVSNKKPVYNSLFEKSFLQAGLYYGTSYLYIKGQQLTDAGVTVGYGINSFRNPLGVNVAMQVGQRGTQQNGLIKERYLNLTFTISYRDLWYTKGKKYE